MIEDAKEQLGWVPVVANDTPEKALATVVGGMGGSALPGHAIRFLDPTYPLSVHHDYDLPEALPDGALYVAISYSGDTEETISFAHAAHAKGLPLAVVTSGGALQVFAEENKLPLVLVPGGHMPRLSLVYQTRALAALLGRDDLLSALSAAEFDGGAIEKAAATLSTTLAPSIPLFYASRSNGFIAYLYKAMVNESAKMPAFADVFPELNHNEMQAFDTSAPATAKLVNFVLLRGASDHPRVVRRMDVFEKLMRDRGHPVINLPLGGRDRASVLAESWLLARALSEALAKARGVDADAIPLVAEFKRDL